MLSVVVMFSFLLFTKSSVQKVRGFAEVMTNDKLIRIQKLFANAHKWDLTKNLYDAADMFES